VTYTYRCRVTKGGLLQDGPLVDAVLSPPQIQADQMITQGQNVPRVKATLMIDTGAGKTAIDKSLASKLNLKPIRYDEVVGVSQQSQECPVYLLVLRLRVDLEGKTAEYSYITEALGVPSPRERNPHDGFLGRDFLKSCRLVYDGPSALVEFQVKA
jgi:hypothetical protein